MPSICRLFYVSSAAPLHNSRTIQDILHVARRNNSRLDVTGCLLYSGRYYAQVLEGSNSVVPALAQRIAADPRHKDVVILMETHRPEREFGDWSTGYLHDLSLEDKLEALLLGHDTDPLAVANLLTRMKPDTVMGAFQ